MKIMNHIHCIGDSSFVGNIALTFYFGLTVIKKAMVAMLLSPCFFLIVVAFCFGLTIVKKVTVTKLLSPFFFVGAKKVTIAKLPSTSVFILLQRRR